jgi:hypothetical protein
MQATVFHATRDVRVETVPDPSIVEKPEGGARSVMPDVG